MPLIIKRNAVKKYIPDFGKSEIIIPEGIVEIEEMAFEGVDSIRYVKCPSTLTKIGGRAFARCVNLEEIEVPVDVDMDSSVFHGCRILCNRDFLVVGGHLLSAALQDSEIIIPEGVRVICREAFDNVRNTLRSVTMPESVEIIGESAFSDCALLKKVYLPLHLREIRQNAFHGCVNLEDLLLPEQVETIEAGTFSECHSLAHIKLPRGLREIKNNAFNNCNSLREVTVNSNVIILSNAFKNCVSLREVILNHDCDVTIQEKVFFGCSTLAQYNGAIYIGNILYKYVSERKELYVPSFATKIAAGAFCNCQT